MLGNSEGARLRLGLALGAILVLATACVKNVPQASHTGKDGTAKGAEKVKLDNGEARAKGIVTYPGGDRVDWKLIELPKDETGTLELRLSWAPPRPGLDLSFKVYDQYFWYQSGAKPRKHSRRRSKKVTINHAQGNYYVMIYASERGDAGKYTLAVNFTPDPKVVDFDLSQVTIPDPPKLPTVPEPPVPCDPNKYDAANPACKNVCPNPPDPKLPACSNVCPTPPDANVPACQKTMACPNPPDRRVRSCTADKWPACDPAKRDPGNPNCDNFHVEVEARVIDVQIQGGGVIITVNAGSTKGVAQGWKGQVIVRGRPVPGGDFTVIRVTKTQAVGKVQLNADTVRSAKIILSEP